MMKSWRMFVTSIDRNSFDDRFYVSFAPDSNGRKQKKKKKTRHVYYNSQMIATIRI